MELLLLHGYNTNIGSLYAYIIKVKSFILLSIDFRQMVLLSKYVFQSSRYFKLCLIWRKFYKILLKFSPFNQLVQKSNSLHLVYPTMYTTYCAFCTHGALTQGQKIYVIRLCGVFICSNIKKGGIL